MSGGRRALAPRSRPYAAIDSAQVFGSAIVGFIKGKSAIHIARTFMGKRRNYTGQHFWARGYYVSTVGREESIIREYIRKQEVEDKRLDQMGLW
jgi:putative transposase